MKHAWYKFILKNISKNMDKSACLFTFSIYPVASKCGRPTYVLSDISEYITQLHCDLCWFRVQERIRFRLCVLTYCCLNVTPTSYHAESTCRVINVDGVTREHSRFKLSTTVARCRWRSTVTERVQTHGTVSKIYARRWQPTLADTFGITVAHECYLNITS